MDSFAFCKHVISAHGRSEITKIISNPYTLHNGKPSELISIAHDGLIKVWKLPAFELSLQTRIRSPYLTCIIPF